MSAAGEGLARDALLHITDLHFWKVTWNPLRLMGKRFLGNANLWLRRRRQVNIDLAETTADLLCASGVRCVVAGGDLTTTSLAEEYARAAEFLDLLAARGLRVWAIPGNHDVYTFGSARRDLFRRFLGRFMPGDALPVRVALPGGTPLIFAPTTCPNLITSRGRVTRPEIMETARLVADSPPGPVIVAGHYPLLFKTDAYHEQPTHRLRNAAALRDALGETGRTLLYLAGHVHRFSETADVRHPAMTHVTSPALFYSRGGGYSEITVRDGGFQVRLRRTGP